jgi:hypothetical protein
MVSCWGFPGGFNLQIAERLIAGAQNFSKRASHETNTTHPPAMGNYNLRKETAVKSLKTVILFLSIFAIAFCTQAAAQKSEDGNAIPYPKKEWKGVQGKTLADSKPDFIGQPKAPDDAPNVLIIMLDDAGYSSATSYGGVMKTPTFDRLGDEGIRYTHMSVAAVCSPTRGSLVDRL